MIYLILCILSSTGIFVIFKFLDLKKLSSFPVIIINYLIASLIGFLINSENINFSEIVGMPWISISVLIGFLFIDMFFVIARSSQEAGISITTVASKMAVVFPITLSILIEPDDELSLLKGIAILAALLGVILTIYEPGRTKGNKSRILIPILLFIGMGLVDSLVKFAQYKFVRGDDAAIFSAILFAMAFFTGILILPFRKQGLKEYKNPQIWLWGILLGIVNFGSIYLMVSALNHVNSKGVQMDSSVIFGANNIGIVSLSVFAGLFLFREKLFKINWIGIAVSAFAILMFSLS
jgi:drug/metabolite transporter (DMT)-like permease